MVVGFLLIYWDKKTASETVTDVADMTKEHVSKAVKLKKDTPAQEVEVIDEGKPETIEG